MDAKQKSELLNDAYTKDLGGEPGTTAQLFREFFKSKSIVTPVQARRTVNVLDDTQEVAERYLDFLNAFKEAKIV